MQWDFSRQLSGQLGGQSVWRRCFLFIALGLFPATAVQAAASSLERGGGVELSAGMTFLGEHAGLAATYRFDSNQVYAGPRIFVTRALHPVDDPYGFLLGYRRYVGYGRLRALFGPEYHITAFRGIDYTAHEFLFNYGIEWSFATHAYVVNSFGYGLFYEKLESGSLTEIDGLIKLSFGYRF